MITIAPKVGSLAWYREQSRVVSISLGMDTSVFEAAVLELKIACQILEKATKKQIRENSAFFKEIARTNPNKRLPRKTKKLYIQKYGRQAYYTYLKRPQPRVAKKKTDDWNPQDAAYQIVNWPVDKLGRLGRI